MNSKDAMRSACKEAGVKIIAENMSLSPTAIYNQINDDDKNDILARFVDFANACGNDIPIAWACEELNGMFVRNPHIRATREQFENDCVSDALKEFSDVIKEIGSAMADGKITKDEAQGIRKEWEELKRLLEAFVLACEFGYLDEEEEPESP